MTEHKTEPTPQRPIAIVSLNHHIEQGHEGAWGNCDFDCCMEAREEAARA